MHQGTTVWNTLTENNHGGSIPINSDGSKNGLYPDSGQWDMTQTGKTFPEKFSHF